MVTMHVGYCCTVLEYMTAHLHKNSLETFPSLCSLGLIVIVRPQYIAACFLFLMIYLIISQALMAVKP